MAKVGCILQIGILFASLDISYSPGQLKQMLIKHKAIRIIGKKKRANPDIGVGSKHKYPCVTFQVGFRN